MSKATRLTTVQNVSITMQKYLYNDFTFGNKLLAYNLAWPLKMKLPSATNTEILLKFNLVISNICNGHIFSSGCYYKGIYFIGDAIDYSGNDKFQYL